MSTPNSPADWRFRGVRFGTPTPPESVRVAFAPIHESMIDKLAGDFRKLLEPVPEPPESLKAVLRPNDVVQVPPLIATVAIAPHAPLHAQIDRFNDTAAVVLWVHRMTVEVGTNRRGGHLQAVSLYLSGVERKADNAAISVCRQMRILGKPLPVAPELFDALLKDERPLAVQIFCESLARVDPSIETCFHAFGVAFFGSMGVASDEERA